MAVGNLVIVGNLILGILGNIQHMSGDKRESQFPNDRTGRRVVSLSCPALQVRGTQGCLA